jgi:hypothetical protein
MRYLLIFVLFIALVTGCASHTANPQKESSNLEAYTKASFVQYVNCMKEAAYYYSPSAAQPSEVADAAHSKCGKEFYEYGRSYEDYLTSLVSPSGVTMARDNAQSATRKTEAQVKGKVIQWVIENRLHKQ